MTIKLQCERCSTHPAPRVVRYGDRTVHGFYNRCEDCLAALAEQLIVKNPVLSEEALAYGQLVAERLEVEDE